MEWQSISELKVWDLINEGRQRMIPPQKQLWDVIKITPIKWEEATYGRAGGGFWVVGIVGESVL